MMGVDESTISSSHIPGTDYFVALIIRYFFGGHSRHKETHFCIVHYCEYRERRLFAQAEYRLRHCSNA